VIPSDDEEAQRYSTHHMTGVATAAASALAGHGIALAQHLGTTPLSSFFTLSKGNFERTLRLFSRAKTGVEL